MPQICFRKNNLQTEKARNGCGNGRYLGINPSIYKLGCDTCPPFLEQARVSGHELALADNIALPFKNSSFDAVISIGVIHHFASLERRIRALSELSRILNPGGRLMIYVWAFEQIHRRFESQDVLIPWVQPQIKGPTRGILMTSSSEPSRGTTSSPSNPDRKADLPSNQRLNRPPGRWRHPRDRVDGKHRSKSQGDRRSSTDDDGSASVPSRRADPGKFGVFDRRDSNQNEDELTGNVSLGGLIGEGDGRLRGVQIPTCRAELKGDSKAVTKWSGQLVTECRKLGLFLRSLSNKSEGQFNREADQGGAAIHGLVRCQSDTNVQSQRARSKRASSSVLYRTMGFSPNEVNRNKTPFQSSTQGKSVDSSCPSPFTGCDLKSFCPSDQLNIMKDVSGTLTTTRVGLGELTSVQSPKVGETVRPYCENGNFEDLSSVLSRPTEDLSLSQRHIKSQRGENVFRNPLNSSCPSVCYNKQFNMNRTPSESSLPENKDSGARFSLEKDIKQEIHFQTLNDGSPTEHLDKCSKSNTVSKHNNERVPSLVNHLNNHDFEKYQLNSTKAEQASSIIEPILASEEQIPEPAYSTERNPRSPSLDVIPILPENQNSQDYLKGKGDPANTSTEVNCGVSDVDECVDIDSLSSGCGNYSADSSSQQRQANPKKSRTKKNKKSGSGQQSEAKAEVSKSNASGINDRKQERIERRKSCKSQRRSSSREVVPIHFSLKTFLHRVANYFGLSSRTEAASTFSCYSHHHHFRRRRHPTSSSSQLTSCSDSSDSETPVTGVSTHSVCHPGLFTSSNSEEDTTLKDEVEAGKDQYMENTASTQPQERPKRNTLMRKHLAKKQISLDISVAKSAQSAKANFFSDMTGKFTNKKKDELSCDEGSDYMFAVEDLSHSSLRKPSLLQTLSHRMSHLFNKEASDGQKPGPNSTIGPLLSCSQSTGLNILPHSQELDDPDSDGADLTRRPTSLDFNKKRTRKRGRRPAPRRQVKDVSPQPVANKEEPVVDDGPLTLVEAMTLIGDGVSEELVASRLDDTAKIVYTKMKRMKFAIRQFPMSSIDSDNSDDIGKRKPDQSSHSAMLEMTPTIDSGFKNIQAAKHDWKIRREKRISLHRRYSDSATSKNDTTGNKKRKWFALKIDDHSPTRYSLQSVNSLSEDNIFFADMLDSEQRRRKLQFFNSARLTQMSDFMSADLSPSNSQVSLCLSATGLAEAMSPQKTETPQEATVKARRGFQVTTGEQGKVQTLNKTNSTTRMSEINLTSQSADSKMDAGISSESEAYQTPQDKPRIGAEEVDRSLSRYYHVFKNGELNELIVRHVPSLQIVDTFYDHANWCVIAEKI